LRVCERIPSRRQAADASRIAALLLLAIASGYDSSSRLALRAPRPPGSVRGFIHKLSVEAVERRRVPPRNGRPLFGGDVLEVLRQRLARVRPRRVAVRVVGRPHDVAEPRPVPRRYPREIADERGVSLAVPVRARLLGDDRLRPEPMLLE